MGPLCWVDRDGYDKLVRPPLPGVVASSRRARPDLLRLLTSAEHASRPVVVLVLHDHSVVHATYHKQSGSDLTIWGVHHTTAMCLPSYA